MTLLHCLLLAHWEFEVDTAALHGPPFECDCNCILSVSVSYQELRNTGAPPPQLGLTSDPFGESQLSRVYCILNSKAKSFEN